MKKLFSAKYIVKDGKFYNADINLDGFNPDEFMLFYTWDSYIEDTVSRVVNNRKSIKEEFYREDKRYLLDVEYIIDTEWNLNYTVYELEKKI